jgi:hypothetical protein
MQAQWYKGSEVGLWLICLNHNKEVGVAREEPMNKQ